MSLPGFPLWRRWAAFRNGLSDITMSIPARRSTGVLMMTRKSDMWYVPFDGSPRVPWLASFTKVNEILSIAFSPDQEQVFVMSIPRDFDSASTRELRVLRGVFDGVRD